jgi:hypothetical protein
MKSYVELLLSQGNALAIDSADAGSIRPAQLVNYDALVITNVPPLGRQVALPPRETSILLRNDKASRGIVRFTVGTAYLDVAPGGTAAAALDGTANGLAPLQPGDGGSGGGEGGGGGTPPSTAPKVDDFFGYDGDPGITTGAGGMFQATDDPDGLLLVMSGQPNGDRWKGLAYGIAAANRPWTARVHALLDYSMDQYSCSPLIVYRDGGANATVLGKNVAGNTAAVTMPRAGVGYNGNPYESAQGQQYEWFRVDFDGNDTLTFYASKTGKVWAKLFTQGVAGTYGGLIDRIALGVECNKPGSATGVLISAFTVDQTG